MFETAARHWRRAEQTLKGNHMPNTISRKFILSILGAAVAVTTLAARPAHALSEEDAAKLLFGAAALFMIGHAITDDDKPARVTRHTHVPPKPRHSHNSHHPKPRPLPERARISYKEYVPRGCVRTFETNRRGSVSMLGARCLDKHYPQAHLLPKTCRTRIHTPAYGVVKGYDQRCLKDKGFKLTRRK
ncbi:hypothetical protein [Shimia sp. SDUM112013]|uniref:hypothetical protein n=1 Tax=Shimia sp. SDUM112013 TaxID=3136160 RepID=UPI0032EB421C